MPKGRIGAREFSPSWEFSRGDSNSGSLKTNTNTFPATVSGSSLVPCRESPLPAQGISCGCRGRARGRGAAAPRQRFPVFLPSQTAPAVPGTHRGARSRDSGAGGTLCGRGRAAAGSRPPLPLPGLPGEDGSRPGAGGGSGSVRTRRRLRGGSVAGGGEEAQPGGCLPGRGEPGQVSPRSRTEASRAARPGWRRLLALGAEDAARGPAAVGGVGRRAAGLAAAGGRPGRRG